MHETLAFSGVAAEQKLTSTGPSTCHSRCLGRSEPYCNKYGSLRDRVAGVPYQNPTCRETLSGGDRLPSRQRRVEQSRVHCGRPGCRIRGTSALRARHSHRDRAPVPVTRCRYRDALRSAERMAEPARVAHSLTQCMVTNTHAEFPKRLCSCPGASAGVDVEQLRTSE